jgi:hypothetical protein
MSHSPLPRDRRLLHQAQRRNTPARSAQQGKTAGATPASIARQPMASLLQELCAGGCDTRQAGSTVVSVQEAAGLHPSSSTSRSQKHKCKRPTCLKDSWPGVSMTSRPGSFRSNCRPFRSSSVRVSTAAAGGGRHIWSEWQTGKAEAKQWQRSAGGCRKQHGSRCSWATAHAVARPGLCPRQAASSTPHTLHMQESRQAGGRVLTGWDVGGTNLLRDASCLSILHVGAPNVVQNLSLAWE